MAGEDLRADNRGDAAATCRGSPDVLPRAGVFPHFKEPVAKYSHELHRFHQWIVDCFDERNPGTAGEHAALFPQDKGHTEDLLKAQHELEKVIENAARALRAGLAPFSQSSCSALSNQKPPRAQRLQGTDPEVLAATR
jgi:hypothetical protein